MPPPAATDPPANADRRSLPRRLDRLVRRLPDRLQSSIRGAHRAGRQVRTAVARTRVGGRAAAVRDRLPVVGRPLVSVIVPVYDVAEYLPACLDSVLGQTYRRLQVVAVDDGSPDGSIDILGEYAARDPRIEIVRQPNAGLGAARNTGVSRARGRYLMFVDSDDVLVPTAVATHVDSLSRTGSDFSVALYERFDAAGTRPAAPWIRRAHRWDRPGTTLAADPDILVNAVAWSKCYRREFWDRVAMVFPAGLYEDQASAARAYARARRFDVLSAVLYRWRLREGGGSITQRGADVDNLAARFAAARDTLAELRAAGAETARTARQLQLLSNDFPLYIRASQHTDEGAWQELRTGLAGLTDDLDDAGWQQVPVQHRIAALLVARDLRAETVEFVGEQHFRPRLSPGLIRHGRVHVQFAAREALGLAPDDPALALAEEQIELVAVVHRIGWRPGDRLEIQGWAYLDLVDLDGLGDDLRLSARLVDLDHPAADPLALNVSRVTDPQVAVLSNHAYADYSPGAFRTEVDAERLAPGRRYGLRMQLAAHGIERHGPVRRLLRTGSGGALRGRALADGRRVVPAFDRADGLVLTVSRAPYLLRRVEPTAAGIRLTIRTGRPGARSVAGAVQVARPGVRALLATLAPDDDSTVVGVLPAAPPTADGTPPAAVRIVEADGRLAPIAVPEAAGDLGATGLRVTVDGNVGLTDHPDVVAIDGLELTGAAGEPVLALAGRTGLPAGTIVAIEATAGASATAATATVAADGTVAVALPLRADPWGDGLRVLRPATYPLSCQIPVEPGLNQDLTPQGVRPVTLRIADALLPELPQSWVREDLRVEVGVGRQAAVRLVVAPPLTADEAGLRAQRRLQDGLTWRGNRSGIERGAVLLRSYFGEICGCNPLAVHEELRRLDSGHTVYWTVRDHSVVVPAGGIPVIYQSAEWYRLLQRAEFYVDNMHQPVYHTKPAGQVIVQTFHGYPFKQMGLSLWREQQRDVAQIRSYLDRAADWDFLVSPARYGTAALVTEFGFPHEVLEIGYPRNDVLLDERAAPRRAEVRRRLGIADRQRAVLYAPTFRDQLSRNDFAAAMVDFLDLDELSRRLGPDVVLLVRGHAFNARTADRVGSRGMVLDVTDHPDIAGLCLASDAAVLDYSSLRFDYALTGRPMIFMVPDLDHYLGRTRTGLFPFEPTAPGPFVTSTAEVAAAIADLDGIATTYADRYATFRRDFLDLDDGQAARRLVQRVFLR